MNAGTLDKRITIKRPGTLDSIGQATGAASTIATVWAKRQPQRGRDMQQSGRDVSENLETWTIRFRTDVRVQDYFEHGNERYDIEAILNPDRKSSLDLVCKLVR
jgi:SPP1 family predicted phage head-tail adaptor